MLAGTQGTESSQQSNSNSDFRLMRLHQRINVMSLPLICLQIAILSLPSQEMPSQLCFFFEWMMNFIWVNRNLSGLTIALGR